MLILMVSVLIMRMSILFLSTGVFSVLEMNIGAAVYCVLNIR